MAVQVGPLGGSFSSVGKLCLGLKRAVVDGEREADSKSLLPGGDGCET